MQAIDIFRGADLLVTIKPDDNSQQTRQVMGDNELRIQFEMNRYVELMINDYTLVFGETYILQEVPIVNKRGKYSYEYNIVMKAQGHLLARAQFLFLDEDNKLQQPEFTLMGTAEDFLDLIIQNANRISSGWTKGQVLITDYKNLSFNSENCYNALGRIAQEFGTEFYLEGKIVHLTKRMRNTPYKFRLGRNKGLYEIKRTALDNSNVITRLYVIGSDKNIPVDYRQPTVQEMIDAFPDLPVRVQSNRLIMPKGARYVEANVSKYGLIEASHTFEDIYPTRTGVVTSVNPSSIFEFYDASMDFDIKTHVIAGLTPKVTFNTGQLAGYTFDIKSYDHGTKKFMIVKNKDEQVLTVPSAELQAQIGDKYVLTDIMMPMSYITAAEQKLKVAAEKMIAANSEPLLTYQVVLDPSYIIRNAIEINTGDVVHLQDDELNISRPIRVISVTRNIVHESNIQIELSDSVALGTFSAVQSGIQTNSYQIDEIGRQAQNTFNGRRIGDLTIEQGTIVAKDLPTSAGGAGFSELLIENATGKVYRKI